MQLSAGENSVTLTPVRYQFPEMKADARGWDWDANWLVIRGEVRSGELTWTFADACMTTREAMGLAEWLEALAHGRVTAGDARAEGPSFVEPNVSVSFLGHSEGEAQLAWYFSQESSPPDAGDAIRYGRGHPVMLSLSPAVVAAAAAEWTAELASFPER